MALVWWAGALASLALAVQTVVDVAGHSRAAFYGAGYSRTGWLVVLVAGLGLWPVAYGAAVVYWLRARPRVRRAEARLALP